MEGQIFVAVLGHPPSVSEKNDLEVCCMWTNAEISTLVAEVRKKLNHARGFRAPCFGIQKAVVCK